MCGANFLRLGTGKLITFRSKLEGPISVWLCEECFESWEPELDDAGLLILWPKPRGA
jgi:hypothetical protein